MLRTVLAHYCLHFYGSAFLLCPHGSPQFQIQALSCLLIQGRFRILSSTQVWGGEANAFQKQTPPPPGPHIIGEDGQLPALQHVFQFFVGCGPSSCGGKYSALRVWASLRA